MTEDQRRKIEELFATYSEPVGGFVLARVGDEELAEEITSRIFLTVVRKFHQCRRSPAGWLWSIVRTELAGHFRRRRRFEDCDAHVPDCRDLPDDRAQRRETQLQMRAVMNELPDEDQRIIYMKFFQDMRNIDIAQAVGLSPSHVGVLVHRSLKKLRALMDRAPTGGPAD